MELFVFIVAAAMVLGGALGVILRAHPVHAALSQTNVASTHCQRSK